MKNPHTLLFGTPVYRSISGGWTGWATAHPVFGILAGAARQRQRCNALLLAHLVLASHLNPCVIFETLEYLLIYSEIVKYKKYAGPYSFKSQNCV